MCARPSLSNSHLIPARRGDPPIPLTEKESL
jgi:hypothetical protein